jgi:hypothetical protein
LLSLESQQQHQQQQQQQQQQHLSSKLDLSSFDVTISSATSFSSSDNGVVDLQVAKHMQIVTL